jgi:hypothetical protein
VVNINSKSAARKRVREAQNKANEARLGRERQNVDDAASFLVELGRLAAVDEWERNRILEIRAEGERRRHEHRQAGATAVARMQGRGESLTAIAELAGVKLAGSSSIPSSSAHANAGGSCACAGVVGMMVVGLAAALTVVSSGRLTCRPVAVKVVEQVGAGAGRGGDVGAQFRAAQRGGRAFAEVGDGAARAPQRVPRVTLVFATPPDESPKGMPGAWGRRLGRETERESRCRTRHPAHESIAALRDSRPTTPPIFRQAGAARSGQR